MQKIIKNSLNTALNILSNFISEENILKMEQIAKLFAQTFQNGNKILICGNGGSLCDAMHFAEEFTGRFRKERQALPVISISDSSHITCCANDYGFEYVFSRAVQAYGKEDDILILISTSGSSPNIIKAYEVAKEKKIKTIAFLGKDGGFLKDKADYQFIISANTSDRIQELHMLIFHILIEATERILFPENYN